MWKLLSFFHCQQRIYLSRSAESVPFIHLLSSFQKFAFLLSHSVLWVYTFLKISLYCLFRKQKYMQILNLRLTYSFFLTYIFKIDYSHGSKENNCLSHPFLSYPLSSFVYNPKQVITFIRPLCIFQVSLCKRKCEYVCLFFPFYIKQSLRLVCTLVFI